MHTITTEIPSGAVPLDRRTQTVQAIREADRSGLPGFASALAANLRAELDADAQIASFTPTQTAQSKP